MSLIRSGHTVKMVREALCFAQTAVNHVYSADNKQKGMYSDILQDMIDDCDRQRPLGRDGKHGNLHTDNCGCDDRGPDWDVG